MVELTHDSRPIIGRGPPLVATFITLAAVSIGLMVADQRYHKIDQVRELLSAAVHPVQRAVDFPFRAWNWVSGSFADRGRLQQENLELTARLRLANLQLQRFAALEDENRRLREMRARTAGVAEKVLVASILNVDLDPFRHRVLLDKGAVDGVFRGQAVLDGEGIFGQVTKVNAGTAEVILISDPEHAIPVQSNRSGVRTIAVGTGDSNKLSLPFVTVEADLQPGDLLLSTGLGGVFPPGIPGRGGHARQARRHHVCNRRSAADCAARPRSRGAAGVVQTRRHTCGSRSCAGRKRAADSHAQYRARQGAGNRDRHAAHKPGTTCDGGTDNCDTDNCGAGNRSTGNRGTNNRGAGEHPPPPPPGAGE